MKRVEKLGGEYIRAEADNDGSYRWAYEAGYRQACKDAARITDTKSDTELRCMNDCRLIIGDEIRALPDQEDDV